MKRLSNFVSAMRGLFLSAVFVAGFISATSESLALPTVRVFPLGGCCFQFGYSLPAAEAATWVSMTATPGGGAVVTGATSTPNFAIAWAPPAATWTHTLGGPYFPVGPAIVVGTACFTPVGPFIVNVTFTDKFGGTYVIPVVLNCPPPAIIVPGGGSIDFDMPNLPKRNQTEEMSGSEAVMGTSIYPNPTSDETTISLTLASNVPVTITVNDVTGKVVSTIENGKTLNAGTHNLALNTANYTSGVYYVTVKSGDYINTIPLNVVR